MPYNFNLNNYTNLKGDDMYRYNINSVEISTGNSHYDHTIIAVDREHAERYARNLPKRNMFHKYTVYGKGERVTASIDRIDVNRSDLIERPLWFHKRGLMETATGYGRNLRTRYMIRYNNKLYRVYCCIYSNTGTCYIRTVKGDIIINELF